jgi:SAM-dependent methyltransferase
MGRRLHYVAAERDPLYLHALRNRFLRTPNVSVLKLDHENADEYEQADGPFDTVLCINILEYAEDPASVVRSCVEVLSPGGSLIVLVPQSPSLRGSLDRTLGHKRRFRKNDLASLLTSHGLGVTRLYQFNKVSAPAWWLYGCVLRRKHISKFTLKVFDKTVWLWKRIERALPTKGLSLIAVARKL